MRVGKNSKIWMLYPNNSKVEIFDVPDEEFGEMIKNSIGMITETMITKEEIRIKYPWVKI